MTVFACTDCGAALTVPVSRVALPVHAEQRYDYALLGVLMEPGTYAVKAEPFGPPWRRWADVGAAAEAQGWYAPVSVLSGGPPGAVVIAPGDARGTVFIPERSSGTCCGVDGRDGPNLACASCGRPVATRIDDCGRWQAVWLDSRSVRPVTGSAAPHPVLDWEVLCRQRPGIPPVDPPGRWNPIWQAAVAAALARLVALSANSHVSVHGGLVADTFRRTVNALLPSGPPTRTLAVAGPGLPTVATDIALVPQHPQTGGHWAPTGEAVAVPLAFDIWAYLAFHRERRTVSGARAMPDSAHRDDPPPQMPVGVFRPDSAVFLATLARLPEVRQPWLRAIYDRVKDHPYRAPF